MTALATAYQLASKAQRFAKNGYGKKLVIAYNQQKMQVLSIADASHRKYLSDPRRWVGLYTVPIDPATLADDLIAWQAENRERWPLAFVDPLKFTAAPIKSTET